MGIRMGTGLGRKLERKPLWVRFWPKVDRKGPEDCWNWLGAVAGNGYGSIFLEEVAREGGGVKVINAQVHRVAWELTHGEIQDGLVIDHMCKNTLCCNPAHLQPIDQRTNCTVLARPTPFTKNKEKTHCKYGHAFEGDNYVWIRRPVDNFPTRACVRCRPYLANSMYRVDPPEDRPGQCGPVRAKQFLAANSTK